MGSRIRTTKTLAPLSKVAANYWSDIEGVRSATSRVDLEHATARFCSRLGFEHYGYASRTRTMSDDGYEYFHNISGPYGHYRYEHVYRREPEKDPVLAHLRSGQPATAFSNRDGVDGLSIDIYKGILRAAADHGIRAGIGVPLTDGHLRWGFVLMTTPLTDRTEDVRQYLPHLCLFSHFAFLKMQNLRAPAAQFPKLSPRELEVLRWATIGKTSWEIGRILRLSESTINFHLANVAKQLGTRGRRATCARAVALGLASC